MRVFEMRSKEPHLFGASAAQLQLRRMLKELGTPLPPGEIVLLDFRGVKSVTASYLKASLMWLLEAGARSSVDNEVSWEDGGPSPLNVFPMVANVAEEVRAELKELLIARDACCLEATDYSQHAVARGFFHGRLDAALVETLAVLSDLKRPVSAVELRGLHPTVQITATGWNNRLALLYRQRLVQRSKEGRNLMYRPIAEEIRRG